MPIAVGSGAIPKTSAWYQPCSENRAEQWIPDDRDNREHVSQAKRRRFTAVEGKAVGSDTGRHKEQRLRDEGRRDIGGGPVDRGIAVPREGPADEGPGGARMMRASVPYGTGQQRDEENEDKAGRDRNSKQRPLRLVVELEQAPLDARGEQQEI